MLQVTTHQEELFRLFKHPFLSYVFIMKTWKSNDYLPQCCAGKPELTIMLLLPGCCHEDAGNAVTEWMVATNHRSSSYQETMTGDCRSLSEQSDTGLRCTTPEHGSGLTSGCISERMGQRSSSSPCTIMCWFLVTNWIEA